MKEKRNKNHIKLFKEQLNQIQMTDKKQLWLGELANFIVEANQHTWAGEGAEVPEDKVERKGYKELEYSRGVWRLRDSYTGYFRAPGMTTIYSKEQPVWTMAYGGVGQIPGQEAIVKPTFAFLKKALMQITPEMPFRGPEYFYEPSDKLDWTYNMKLERASIEDFKGRERIFHGDNNLVFEQDFFGGIVIPKSDDGQPIFPWDAE
jgi:hypothetical protein